MKNRHDFDEILEFYRQDDRLVRYVDRFTKELESDETACMEELLTEHIWEAYWLDIGGEGA